jgi:hypothetical protein
MFDGIGNIAQANAHYRESALALELPNASNGGRADSLSLSTSHNVAIAKRM